MPQAASDIDEEMAGMDAADDSDEEEEGLPQLKVEANNIPCVQLCCVTCLLCLLPYSGRDTVPHISASLALTDMIPTMSVCVRAERACVRACFADHVACLNASTS